MNDFVDFYIFCRLTEIFQFIAETTILLHNIGYVFFRLIAMLVLILMEFEKKIIK